MVAVGPNMFYTVTLPCTLWFLDRGKRKTPRADKVLFIDARQSTGRSTARTANGRPRRSGSSPTLFGSIVAKNSTLPSAATKPMRS